MMQKKILVVLSGGYNVRNFIYSGFLNHIPEGLEVAFTHSFDSIKELEGYTQHELPKLVSGKLDWIKRTINVAELYKNYWKTKRKSYLDYLILPTDKFREKPLKIKILRVLTYIIGFLCSNALGLKLLNYIKDAYTRRTLAYTKAKALLNENLFEFVFFTHQRASEALGLSIAAKDLNINTACFIYSWDNLPKGNKYLDANHYFVWSSYMGSELQHYYPQITKETIHVTGSPQFVHYALDSFSWSREEFCRKMKLDSTKTFICFSGNDRTTCPVDPTYLEDLAQAVRQLNIEQSENYHVLFRPNPIDRNEDFDRVVNQNSDVITELLPDWKGDEILWNKGIPSYTDMLLLKNTVLHSEFVINMSSTMSMDAALLGKPAIYIRYDVPSEFNWTVEKTYNFIHFDALKGIDQPVIWLMDRNKVQETIKKVLDSPEITLKGRQEWVTKIINHPINKANQNIWDAIESISNEV